MCEVFWRREEDAGEGGRLVGRRDVREKGGGEGRRRHPSHSPELLAS